MVNFISVLSSSLSDCLSTADFKQVRKTECAGELLE